MKKIDNVPVVEIIFVSIKYVFEKCRNEKYAFLINQTILII